MLSDNQQHWILRQLIEGKDHPVDPEQITAYRAEYDLLIDTPVQERKLALLEHLLNYSNGREIFDQIVGAQPPTEDQFHSYADLDGKLPPIEWFWKGWIPRGLITTIAAKGGVGKSLIALDLARRVIAGDTCPDGTPMQTVSNKVIYVDAESVPQLNLERAKVWNIHLENLYPMLPPLYGYIDLNDRGYSNRLIEMVCAIGPGLIVVDSLGSISTKSANAKEDIQPIMTLLAGLAADSGAAVLLIHHSRKRPPNVLPGLPMTADDVMGSAYVINYSRSVLGLSIVQTQATVDLNGPRRLEVLKTNLGVHPPPLGCTFVPVKPDGVRVQYGDAPEPYREPTKAEECEEWLIDLLTEHGGQMKPKEVVALAEEMGFSRMTVYRARSALSDVIVNTDGQQNPNSEWKLAGG